MPSKEHPRHDEARELLREAGFALEPATRKWWLRDRHKTLNFLAAQRERLENLFGAEFTPADAYLFVMLVWAGQQGVDVPEPLKGFEQRMRARPAVQLALKHEDEAKAKAQAA